MKIDKDIPTGCERYDVCALYEHGAIVDECNPICQIRLERTTKLNNVINFKEVKK